MVDFFDPVVFPKVGLLEPGSGFGFFPLQIARVLEVVGSQAFCTNSFSFHTSSQAAKSQLRQMERKFISGNYEDILLLVNIFLPHIFEINI